MRRPGSGVRWTCVVGTLLALVALTAQGFVAATSFDVSSLSRLVVVLLTQPSPLADSLASNARQQFEKALGSSDPVNNSTNGPTFIALHELERESAKSHYIVHPGGFWTIWPALPHIHNHRSDGAWYLFLAPDLDIDVPSLATFLHHRSYGLQQELISLRNKQRSVTEDEGEAAQPAFLQTSHDFLTRGLHEFPGIMSIVHDFASPTPEKPYVDISTGFLWSGRLFRFLSEEMSRDPKRFVADHGLHRDIGYDLSSFLRREYAIETNAVNDLMCGPLPSIRYPLPAHELFTQRLSFLAWKHPDSDLSTRYQWLSGYHDHEDFTPSYMSDAFLLHHHAFKRKAFKCVNGLDHYFASTKVMRASYSGISGVSSSCIVARRVSSPEVQPVDLSSTWFAVKTHSGNHNSRVKSVIKRTWGAFVHGRVTYYSNEVDDSIPTVKLDLDNVERGHGEKLYVVLMDLWDRFKDDDSIQWFVVADDDTVLAVPPLLRMLGRYNASDGIYIGQKYGMQHRHLENLSSYSFGYDYITLGGGGVLSREALRRFVEEARSVASWDRIQCSRPSPQSPDDLWLGRCMQSIGVPIVHERGFHQAWTHEYHPEELADPSVISVHSGPAARVETSTNLNNVLRTYVMMLSLSR